MSSILKSFLEKQIGAEKDKNMNIILKKENSEKVNTELKAVQGRCSVRIFKDADEIMDSVYKAVKKLDICKAQLKDCVLTLKVDGGRKIASSYNGVPMSTYIKVLFKEDGLGRLIEIGRVHTEGGKPVSWELAPKAVKAVLAKFNAQIKSEE